MDRFIECKPIFATRFVPLSRHVEKRNRGYRAAVRSGVRPEPRRVFWNPSGSRGHNFWHLHNWELNFFPSRRTTLSHISRMQLAILAIRINVSYLRRIVSAAGRIQCECFRLSAMCFVSQWMTAKVVSLFFFFTIVRRHRHHRWVWNPGWWRWSSIPFRDLASLLTRNY